MTGQLFVNMNGIDEWLKRSTIDIPYEKITILYRDLFDIIKNEEGLPVNAYSDKEMVHILMDVCKVKDTSLRLRLLDQLKKGGR